MERWLEPGERTVLDVRPHGVALVRPICRALILGAGGAAALVAGDGVHWALRTAGAAVLGIAALAGGAAIWRWDRTSVLLTTRKLLVVQGTVRRRAAAAPLDRAALELRQGVLGRLLGYGTLVAGPLAVRHVPRAHDAVRRVPRH
jgi:hypothetical protein